MVPFKIGNWLITEDGISWDGMPKVKYQISRDRILESGPPGRDKMYDWLVHLPTKSWTTEKDIYALNTAFIYAIEYYGLDFNTCSFVETLIEQKRELGYK